MRIQPITTNKNTNFQKLKIYNPQEWDADVLEAVVKNQSIKDLTRNFAERGQDLVLWNYIKPSPVLMLKLGKEWEVLVGNYTKQSIIDGLENFNHKDFLAEVDAKNQTMLVNQDRCDKLMLEVDEFNRELKSENPKPQVLNH